ncbi:unnamed protein product [Linum trigynum]|uniref:HMA domain-containing protein n=1 Tax=Linum trigynum TaxID=586398 RepID=A0AAV2CSP5_9ROSI
MGKLMGFGKVFDRLCLSPSSPNSNSCFCTKFMEAGDDDDLGEVFEQKAPLMLGSVEKKSSKVVRLKDVVSVNPNQTLAFQLKPKMVILRVSMHCSGCAKKVEKHVSRIDGVSSYKVDLESKRVVVIGDILPYEVLASVSKVKNAQLWM